MADYFSTNNTDAQNIRKFDEEVTKLKNAKDAAEEKAAEAKQKKIEMQQQIYELQRQINQTSDDNGELISKLQDIQEEFQKAVQDCNKMKAINEELESNLNEANRELAIARRTNEMSAAKLREQQLKTNALTVKVSQLKNEAKAREERIKYLNRQLEELQERQRRRRAQNPWLIAGMLLGGIGIAALLGLYAPLLIAGIGICVVIFVVALGIYCALRN